MGIFDALNTSVGGLQAQSFALQNISGNIANASTVGYKGIDTSFEDLVAQSATPSSQVAGGVTAVLQRARAHTGHLVKVEIEVDTLAQLREVLDTGLADVVLLDNMDIAELTEAVQLAKELSKGRVVLEASGDVTLASIAKIAATGVDYASSGALTHSAPNFDVALDIDA